MELSSTDGHLESIMKRLIFAVIIVVAFATYAIQTVGQTSISTSGVIESKSGGFKYPDSSVQLTAVTASPGAVGFVDGPHSRFVSSKGNDANACTLALPCRSFAAGVAAASAGGKVVAMDSGDYGPFTVTKSLTIEAAPGVHAGIAVFTGAGVTVNAAQGEDVIILRGLAIHSSGGEDGINITSGQTHIEKCSITGFKGGGMGDGSQAIHTYKEAFIEDSILIGNDAAVWADGGASLAWVNRTRVETNLLGIYVTCDARAIVRDSVVSNNETGVNAGCRAPSVLVEGTLLARNVTGITSGDTSVIRVTGSSIIYNVIGLQQVGESSLLSRDDNTIEDNDTDTVGVIGGYSPQ
jgi:hypothetical protein